MNKLFLLFLLLFFFQISKAQISALTENGRQVTLYDNGTWKYADSTKAESTDSIKLNPTKFSKSPGATFLVKSNIVNVGVFINPAKWTFAPHHENEANLEYRFTLKSGTGMAMLECEKTPIPLEAMRNIALINARKAAIDAKITKQEFRIVNNKKVLCLGMSGTIQGIQVMYQNYYFSNEKGTIQLVAFSSKALFSEASKELETLLNGLVVLD